MQYPSGTIPRSRAEGLLLSCPSFTTTIVGNVVAIFSTSGEMKSNRVISWEVVLGAFDEDIDVVLKETRRGYGPRCIGALGVLRRMDDGGRCLQLCPTANRRT